MATETVLQVAGMECSHCAPRLGQSLERLDGVIRARVDETGAATVRFDEGRLSQDEVGQRVREAGFDLA